MASSSSSRQNIENKPVYSGRLQKRKWQGAESEDNSETSGDSGGSSPDIPLKINEGGASLTLSQFVNQIEQQSGRNVAHLNYHPRPYRHFLMPVVAPPAIQQPHFDRFTGRGDDFVEDVAYDVANRGPERRSYRGLMFFTVTYATGECEEIQYFYTGPDQ